MPIDLPNWPAPSEARPSLLLFGGPQRSATGGATQIINRMGTRYRMEVSYPPLPDTTQGRLFRSAMVRAARLGVRIECPLAGGQPAAGAPVVDGAGQSGTSLNVRGLTPGYICRQGYWLSITDATGRHYLHQAYVQRVADGAGKAVLGIEPPLRFPFADGAAVFLQTPMLEGFIDGDVTWSLNVAHHIGITITIEEMA